MTLKVMVFQDSEKEANRIVTEIMENLQ